MISFKPGAIFIVPILLLFACSSDDNALTVGENVINDDHIAFYTDEDFDINSETLLAEYVPTNNTGVALCGSYNDDYLGKITTNTVFKISPGKVYIESTEDVDPIFDRTSRFDYIELVLYTDGYIYGDSTKDFTLSVHEVTENYELGEYFPLLSDNRTVQEILTNHDTTSYNRTNIGTHTFKPKWIQGDSITIRLDDSFGETLFDSIQAGKDNYVIDHNDDSDNPNDYKFIKNVLNGITLRSSDNNAAIMGFRMPKTLDDETSGKWSTIKLHYITASPAIETSFDFVIYDEELQYNQITANFEGTDLKDIEPGGVGISSEETHGVTFVHAGLGLMTNIEIPTLNKLGKFGNNMTIIDLDLEISAAPYSFSSGMNLPKSLSIYQYQSNSIINSDVFTDMFGNTVAVTLSHLTEKEASYKIPITTYGITEQALSTPNSSDHKTLLLRSEHSKTNPINRIVIGDSENSDAQMKAEMYYTIFE